MNMNFSDWLRAVQAFEIIGLLLIAAALILTIVVLFVNSNKTIKLIAWICSLAACKYFVYIISLYGHKVYL